MKGRRCSLTCGQVAPPSGTSPRPFPPWPERKGKRVPRCPVPPPQPGQVAGICPASQGQRGKGERVRQDRRELPAHGPPPNSCSVKAPGREGGSRPELPRLLRQATRQMEAHLYLPGDWDARLDPAPFSSLGAAESRLPPLGAPLPSARSLDLSHSAFLGRGRKLWGPSSEDFPAPVSGCETPPQQSRRDFSGGSPQRLTRGSSRLVPAAPVRLPAGHLSRASPGIDSSSGRGVFEVALSFRVESWLL